MGTVAGVFVGRPLAARAFPRRRWFPGLTRAIGGVTIGSAVGTPVTATASGQITATLTHTGYGIVHIDCPFAQGSNHLIGAFGEEGAAAAAVSQLGQTPNLLPHFQEICMSTVDNERPPYVAFETRAVEDRAASVAQGIMLQRM